MPRPLRGTAALSRPSRKQAREHDAPDAGLPGARGFPFGRFVGILYAIPLSQMGPFSFGFFQGIPDAAHWSLPKSSTCFGSSVNDSPWCEPRARNVKLSFRLGNPSPHSPIWVSHVPVPCRTSRNSVITRPNVGLSGQWRRKTGVPLVKPGVGGILTRCGR
jgi:hypothetical protein